MQNQNNILYVVACALLDYGKNNGEEIKILLAKRPAHKVMSGSWEFPGGKIEQGETPEQALARELKEELGIDVDTKDLTPNGLSSFDHGSVHLVIMMFTCTKWKGVPKALEHEIIEWSYISDIENYDMLESDITLIRQLRNNIK